MALFDKFKLGLGKSSTGLSEGLKNIFSKKMIDDNVLTKFEELIISSDAGIDVAKELPKPELTRTEYDLKDQLIRETIENTAEQVKENSEKLDKIDEKLYEIIQK